MRPCHTAIAFIALLSIAAQAEDIKTTDGREYKNVQSVSVEPDGLLLVTREVIVRIPFAKLPADLQKKYGYDPAKAARLQNAAAAERERQQKSPEWQEAQKPGGEAAEPDPADRILTPPASSAAPTPTPVPKWEITGRFTQKLGDGILVVCKKEDNNPEKRPSGLILVKGYPGQDTLSQHSSVRCTVQSAGNYDYIDQKGARRRTPVYRVVGK